MKEIWLPIKGYEGIYEVSNHGRVKSLERDILRSNGTTHRRKERILSSGLFKGHRYRFVILSINGEQTKEYVHRIVATHFIGEPSGDRNHVNHKDGNRVNNHVDNLEWVTHAENMRHAIEMGLKKQPHGEDNPACKFSDKVVMEIRDLHDNNIYRQNEISEIYGISGTQVHRIVRRILRVGGNYS